MTAGGDLPSSDDKPLDMDYENVWDDQHPSDVSDELRSGLENDRAGRIGRAKRF